MHEFQRTSLRELKTFSHTKTCRMFIVAIIHDSQRVGTAQITISCLMRKPNVVYRAMKYYSDIKRNQVLTPITTWMNLENILLSKRSQAQKATYCMIPFT